MIFVRRPVSQLYVKLQHKLPSIDGAHDRHSGDLHQRLVAMFVAFSPGDAASINRADKQSKLGRLPFLPQVDIWHMLPRCASVIFGQLFFD